MKRIWLVILAITLVSGCKKGNGGDEDATDVIEEEVVDTAGEADVDDGAEAELPCTRDGDCDDGDPCTEDVCDTDSGECSHDLYDEDEDGYYAAEVSGTTCEGGDDCNDFLDTVHPGATEECDTIDQNCDGSILDVSEADDDSDGHLDVFCDGDDCNDLDDDIYAGAPEICDDGVDQDCDDMTDEPTAMLGDVRITIDTADSEEPTIAWSGSEFGVAWSDTRDGNAEIYLARVSAAGSKEGSDLRITDAADGSFLPYIIWNGSEYALSWSDDRDGDREIFFVRLSPDGTKIGSDVQVTTAGRASRRSVIEWTGSEYGLAWSDERNGNWEVYFARLATDGSLVGSEVRVTDDVAFSWVSALSWTGSEFGVAFHDDRDGDYEVYFARIDPEGTKLTVDQQVTYVDGSSWVADLAWNGAEWGMTWHDDTELNYEIYFARVNMGGRFGAPVRITTMSGSGYDSEIQWTGSEYVIGWHDDMTGDFELYLSRVDATGTRLVENLRITNEYGESADIALAWTGSEFGAAWTDNRPGNTEIFFNRIDYCE